MQDFANFIMQLIHNSYKQCPPFCFIHNISLNVKSNYVSFGLNDWIIQGVLSRHTAYYWEQENTEHNTQPGSFSFKQTHVYQV